MSASGAAKLGAPFLEIEGWDRIPPGGVAAILGNGEAKDKRTVSDAILKTTILLVISKTFFRKIKMWPKTSPPTTAQP